MLFEPQGTLLSQRDRAREAFFERGMQLKHTQTCLTRVRSNRGLPRDRFYVEWQDMIWNEHIFLVEFIFT